MVGLYMYCTTLHVAVIVCNWPKVKLGEIQLFLFIFLSFLAHLEYLCTAGLLSSAR